VTESREASRLIGAIANVTAEFARLAQWLDSHPGIRSVVHPLWITGGVTESEAPMRVEWFADGELYDGRAVSFGMELCLLADEWLIEPAIRMNTDAGQHDVLDMPVRFAVEDEELLTELRGAMRHLVGQKEKALMEVGLEP